MPPLKKALCTSGLGFAIALLTLASIAIGAEPSHQSNERAQALHVLNRLGYGPRPGDVEQVLNVGLDHYIEQQLAPESLPQPIPLRQRLDDLEATRFGVARLFSDYGPRVRKAAKGDEEAKQELRDDTIRVVEQAQDARLLRAIYSPAQLREVMTEFWFNHFNVFIGKGLDHIWAGAYERDAIRPYALGRFRGLLGATAKHPAMLFYLDNAQSTVDGFRGPGNPTGLNENYARELMELHTLGVDCGYTQKDVTELARILTGWTFNPRTLLSGDDNAFVFAPRRHDDGEKLFLGEHVESGGQAEGERAMDRLAAHPATAKHIAYELAQFFVADDPPPALVDRLAQRFRESGGDTREVLRTLFASREFRDPANFGNKFKTPYQYVVSALRASNAPTTNLRPVLGVLRQLGEPIYGCQTPDGYKNTQAAWLSPGAMINRVNFATALGAGRLPLARHVDRVDNDFPSDGDVTKMVAFSPIPEDQAQPVDPIALEGALSGLLGKNTQGTVSTASMPLRSGLILGSPEFMMR